MIDVPVAQDAPLIFKPKIHKTVELLVHLAHVLPDTSKYRACKLIYLADRRHLHLHGRPITFEAYYALPSGPCGMIALDLIENHKVMLRAAGLLELPFATYPGREDGKATTFVGKPARPVDLDHLSESDVDVFDGIVAEYGRKTARELKDETHGHDAFKKAWGARGPNRRMSLMDYADIIAEGPFREKVKSPNGAARANIPDDAASTDLANGNTSKD